MRLSDIKNPAARERILKQVASETKPTETVPEPEPNGVSNEKKLHDDIMAWCDTQWPRWKYIHSRTDKATTNECGVADFIVFAPGGTVHIVECKKKDGKLSAPQRDWAHEIERLGHVYHVVRCMEDWEVAVGKKAPVLPKSASTP